MSVGSCHSDHRSREIRSTGTRGNTTSVSSPPYIEILRGRDGRDGLPGTAGRDGKDGEQGLNGEQGLKGDPGLLGPRGVSGLRGPPGTAAKSGVVYTRWGRTPCPSGQGSELVYSGRAAGTRYSHKGGAANRLCMPDNPQYSSRNAAGVNGRSPVYGAEYHTYEAGAPISRNFANHNVPCAVCHVRERGSLLMIPARRDCPASWTKEYEGALMAEHYTHHRSMFECVDLNPESVPGSSSNVDGALFHHTEAVCSGLPCPPYNPAKELLCVVCTK